MRSASSASRTADKAEEMHWKYRLRPRGDLALHIHRIQVQRDGVDVDEDGCRLAAGDRLGGRVERERRTDHLVAAAAAEGIEDDDDRVRPVGDADRLRHTEKVGGLALERRDVGPKTNCPFSSTSAKACLSCGISGAY